MSDLTLILDIGDTGSNLELDLAPATSAMDIGTVEATHIGYRHHAYTLDSYTDTTDIRFFLSSFTIQEEIELEREK